MSGQRRFNSSYEARLAGMRAGEELARRHNQRDLLCILVVASAAIIVTLVLWVCS